MCFLFIPQEEELAWFNQLEFGFWVGRQIMEEWRYGLLPESCDQWLDYLMGLCCTSDCSKMSRGCVNLGTKFPEESEYCWIRMTGWDFIGSSRCRKHQWWFVSKLNLYLSVGMDSYAMSICWQMWSFPWHCRHTWHVVCMHAGIDCLVWREWREGRLSFTLQCHNHDTYGIEQKSNKNYFSTPQHLTWFYKLDHNSSPKLEVYHNAFSKTPSCLSLYI